MSKDKSMNEEDWNAWTADVRTWLSEVETHMANSINAGMDEDMVEDMIEDIQKNLNRGDKRDTRRLINKQHIQDAGRDLAGWPVRFVAVVLNYRLKFKEHNKLYWLDLNWLILLSIIHLKNRVYHTMKLQGLQRKMVEPMVAHMQMLEHSLRLR